MITTAELETRAALTAVDAQLFLDDLLTLTRFWEDGLLSDEEFLTIKRRLPRHRRGDGSTGALFVNSCVPLD